VRPESGPRPEPGQLLLQRDDGSDDGDRGSAQLLRSRALGDVGQGGDERALARERALLHDGDGLGRGPAARDQPLGDARQRADAHVEDERAGKRRERRPVERGLRLGGILVPRHEGDAAGHVAMGDRDAGVRRRRDPGRDAGHDLEGNARLPQRQRLLAAAPEHERIATLQAHNVLAGAGVLDQEAGGLLLRELRALPLLADVDALGPHRRPGHRRRRDQAVVEDHVGPRHELERAAGHQP
jgi:hypothetical protein